ncbi:MAG: hypothetical protein KKE82_07230, partial [Proteobacteria bacterium]|nr:hypothetical protein [Pseudomonadota bacterium]
TARKPAIKATAGLLYACNADASGSPLKQEDHTHNYSISAVIPHSILLFFYGEPPAGNRKRKRCSISAAASKPSD